MTMLPDDDPILSRLKELPCEGPDELLSERVRRRAHGILSRGREGAGGTWQARALVAGGRLGASVLLALTVGAYLKWAIDAASLLYR